MTLDNGVELPIALPFLLIKTESNVFRCSMLNVGLINSFVEVQYFLHYTDTLCLLCLYDDLTGPMHSTFKVFSSFISMCLC